VEPLHLSWVVLLFQMALGASRKTPYRTLTAYRSKLYLFPWSLRAQLCSTGSLSASDQPHFQLASLSMTSLLLRWELIAQLSPH